MLFNYCSTVALCDEWGVKSPVEFPHDRLPRSLRVGGPLAVHADGFLPATTVRIRIESDPRALGTAITDADGAISTVVRLPSDIPTGDHHSVVIGTDPDGNLRAVAGEVVVLPQGGPLLYLWLGLGGLLTITGAALRPCRRRVS